MPNLKHIFCCLLIAAPVAAAASEPSPGPATPEELDQRTQEVKSEVLDLEAELAALERDIRFPAATRWTVFVTATPIPDFTLETVSLLVGGRTIATHQYDRAQRQALADGGAHRLYIGNLAPGSHDVSVQLTARRAGDAYTRTDSFQLDKPKGPRLLELQLRPDPQTEQGREGPGFAAKRYADRP